jgi:hypothetical protein
VSVGLVLALLLGLCVGPLLGKVEKFIEIPEPKASKEVWDFVMVRSGTGVILGAVEQAIFFVALWTDGWPLLASWLAFKVASKWQSWTHVAQLPPPPPPADAAATSEYAILRHKWVARRYITFVVGTGTNILLAAFGVAIGRIVVIYG